MKNDRWEIKREAEINELRKKGWSEIKIARWRSQRDAARPARARRPGAAPLLHPAWREILDKAEVRRIGRRFKEEFLFRAGTEPLDWPGIREPVPSITYQITEIWQGDITRFNALTDDLCSSILAAFREIVPVGQRVTAWDPYHQLYEWDPHQFGKPLPRANWPILPLPNSEYTIFLDASWQNGLFGHPWEQTLCVIGDSFVGALAHSPVKLLHYIVRRDGRPVNPLKPLARFGRGSAYD
jgi:hypothetical protein